MAFLEVNGIFKSFGRTEVLKGIDFSMEKGEVLAIIGSSGSGKTTLLRCLNFLETPDMGRIVLDGKELYNTQQKYSDREIREKRLHFGLVFQSFNLFPQYTVLKNVCLAPELMLNNGTTKMTRSEKSMIYKEIENRARGILASVGLSDKLMNYPCELSGGQQQRVAIARALAMEPVILCFDEPTSALDPELTGEVLRVIKELKNSGRTMILVTHEMGFARNAADKVIFMADGVIEEYGTPEEVFGNPKSEKTISFLEKSLENITCIGGHNEEPMTTRIPSSGSESSNCSDNITNAVHIGDNAQSSSKVNLEKQEPNNKEIQQELIKEIEEKKLTETPQKKDSTIWRWVGIAMIVAVIAIILISSGDAELRSTGASMMKGVVKTALRVGAILLIPLIISIFAKLKKK